MKYQILFSEKSKKKYYQFVVCWISPESSYIITLSIRQNKKDDFFNQKYFLFLHKNICCGLHMEE